MLARVDCVVQFSITRLGGLLVREDLGIYPVQLQNEFIY